MQVDEVWRKTLGILKENLSSASFEMFVKPARAVVMADNTMVIEAPNEFARDWLSRNLSEQLAEVVHEVCGGYFNLSFQVGTPAAASEAREAVAVAERPPEKPAAGPALPKYGILNPKYTFSSFVVGNHSSFAHAAAIAVAENPARAYNPLFIYGGVGLGKTHLMHAVGHALLQHQPRAQVAYLSSEKFTNELINSIRDKRMEEFRARYRNIDLLLIDDIQFIEGKDHTQEEFFHTFNALHESGKQIVLSSDRPPKDIATLEARLRSRFEWGLITDIQAPDLETRIAILKKKADTEGLLVDDAVLHYIAASFQSNVRELEGAFIRVMAYASLNKVQPTVELAQQILGQAVRKPVTLARIREIVANHFNMEVAELLTARRTKEVSWARQVAMFLSRELTESSLPKIGMEYGGRDHTTVIHACDKVKNAMKGNAALAEELQKLTHLIKG